MRWGVVIAAGGSAPPDLAARLGVPNKALAPILGKTSLEWILHELGSWPVERRVVVGPESLRRLVGSWEWVAESGSAIDNVLAGVEALGPQVEAVLMLPSDAPLLTRSGTEHFVQSVEARCVGGDGPGERWFAAGLASATQFRQQYPQLECIPLRLRGEPLLAGGLYAASPAGLRHAVSILQVMRHSRKSQLKMALRLGLGPCLRYFMRRITLVEAEQIVGRFFGGPTILVSDCEPESVIDFDSADEFDRVLETCVRRGLSG
ncbi:MAG TPA: NTP transferase domain-containing protein [Fimbriimonadaceae bacterium]|nr:NTP transferase domain-containing protein [Fimbriimonadaceae bacterium]